MKLSYNKRLALWLLGVTVLVVAFSVGAEVYIASESKSLLSELAILPEQVEGEEWGQAEAMLDASLDSWRQTRRIWLGLLSHQEVWNIDTAYISLNSFLAARNRDEVMNQISLLQYYLQRVAEDGRVVWHNFF